MTGEIQRDITVLPNQTAVNHNLTAGTTQVLELPRRACQYKRADGSWIPRRRPRPHPPTQAHARTYCASNRAEERQCGVVRAYQAKRLVCDPVDPVGAGWLNKKLAPPVSFVSATFITKQQLDWKL
jgi:hypothetical protein